MTHFFQVPDGRRLSSSLVQAAVPRPGGRWLLSLRNGFEPVEVDNDEFMRSERLIRASRDEYAIGEDKARRRVLFWRIERGSAQASPVFGLQVEEPSPIDFSASFNNPQS